MPELVDRDEEHLRLLKIGYYILAGINTFVALFPLVFLGVGTLIATGKIPMNENSSTREDPRIVGLFMVGIGTLVLISGIAGAVLTFLTARGLRDRRRRILCLVVAGICCLYIPWGTALGVFTIMVLNRPSVRSMFGEHSPPAGPIASQP